MDKLVLTNIQALAASVDYGGRGFLQSSSAALGLSAALFLSNLSLWQGAGYSLTEAEIDDIQAMIAQLENDLMETGDMYPVDKVQVTNSIDQDIATSTLSNLFFDTEIYDPQGMHSTVVNTNRINVLNDGLHLINVNIQWESNNIGYRQLYLYRYDLALATLVLIAQDARPSSSVLWRVFSFVATQDEAKEGDYYQLLVYQTSGVDLAVEAVTYSPMFSVVRF